MKVQTVALAPNTFRAAVRSIDREKRTVEMVISTGARVLRHGWDGDFYEELSLEKKHVRMKRLNNGAPLLNSHGSGWGGATLEDVLGVVESARIEDDGGPMVGLVRFPRAEDDPAADQAFRKVADGILPNVSVGYRTYRLEKIEEGDGRIPVMRATDWEPFEVSLVPMGADDGAKVRSEEFQSNSCQVVAQIATRSAAPAPPKPPKKETRMPPHVDDTASETIAETDPLNPGGTRTEDPPPDQQAAAVSAERERCQGITLGARAARLPQAYADKLIADGTSLVVARGQILAELGKRGGDDRGPRPGPSGATFENDPLVHVRKGIENALLHRISPEMFKLDDAGREYRGMTMLRVAEAYLNARGVRTTRLSKMELAGLALGLDTRGGMHTTSDFPILLADVANKTLREAYAEAEQTFKAIGSRTTLTDFKPSNRVQLGNAPALQLVNEHGEFTRGTIAEGKEVFQLATYGRVFAITRQALINDDTDAFSRVAILFGRAARTLESDLVWAQITSNPIMGDGNALFSVAHNNLDGTPSVISVASLSKARAAMRVQKDLDTTTVLNLNPKTLLVPAALETVAQQNLTIITPALPGSANPFAGLLGAVVEPRLDANSVTAWYLAASPEQIDIITYAYLEGQDGPMTESRIGFDVDGLEIKCRHDFAAKVTDWRGLYKNPGV